MNTKKCWCQIQRFVYDRLSILCKKMTYMTGRMKVEEYLQYSSLLQFRLHKGIQAMVIKKKKDMERTAKYIKLVQK